VSSGASGDTRARIQEVALTLFTEQGYERTSLREIAEHLGVTKAALYYHFRSKDDIVTSVVSDRIDRLDEMIKWAEEQPGDAAGRRAVISRYADEFFTDESHSVMRFFEQNPTMLKSLSSGQMLRQRMLHLADVLAGPDGSPSTQLRATLAILAVQTSWFALRDPGLSPTQRRQIALEAAHELLDRIDTAPALSDAGDSR
jgi:AcrR family transcriptional regulator